MRHTERGSTLLLVLAMLSILFLIGAALSFGTRLESQASLNYAQLIQARQAAITGLPTAFSLIAPAANGLTTTLQPWYVAPSEWNKSAQTSGNSTIGGARANTRLMQDAGIRAEQLASGEMRNAPQVIFSISDMSSRVNLNSVRKEESLAKLLDAVLPASAGDPKAKARALFALRGGDKVSTSAKRLDLRRGDGNEKRLTNLAALSQKRGKNTAPLFSDDELRTLSNYLTVFSESPEVFNAVDGTSVPKVILQQISMDSVLRKLRKAFPQKDDALLQQFAANVTDFTDTDDIPTLVQPGASANSQPWQSTFGFEQTPLITEVYPDATSLVTEGDHGQFVEISNPWQKPLVLTGWRLTISDGSGIAINQVLPPGGTLIITDNYDQPAQNSRPGTGSFLSIFGAQKDEGLRKVQVAGELTLPDRDNFVALYDAQGNLIDAFAYGSPGQQDTRVSLQRDDPRLRVSKAADATPFDQAAGGSKFEAVRAAWRTGNQPVVSVVELFKVATAYVAVTTGTANLPPAISNAHPWQLPTLQLASVMERTNLDLRLLDLFTNWQPDTNAADEAEIDNVRSGLRRRVVQASANANHPGAVRSNLSRRGANGGQQSNSQIESNDTSTTTELVYSYGKLNLNTCAKASLLGLDIKLGGAQWPTTDALEKFEAYRLRRLQEKKAPFRNVSDFVVEFMPNLKASDLPELVSLLDQVTVGSSAFEITAQNRLSPEESTAGKDNTGKTPDRLTRRPAIAKARWLITLDQHPYSLVQFNSVP